MYYGLGDHEQDGEAHRQRKDKIRERGQKADGARRAEGKEEPLTEEIREVVAGVR